MGVRVRAERIEDASLPPVCPVTGGAAPNWQRVRYVSPAGSLVFLLFFGVLPYVIARAITRREVSGRLPISDEGIAIVKRLRRTRRRLGLGVLVAYLALLAVIVEAPRILTPFAVGMAAAAAVGLFSGLVKFREPVVGEVDGSGRWVELSGVSAAFARAVADPTRSTGATLTCPDCAESILPAAKVCRFCGHRLQPTGTTKTV